MEQWMKNSVESDVNTAIQSQTIQTALERNASVLTDSAFQSFLTNAPIPRLYYDSSPTVIGIGNNTITWNTVGSVDPYSMMVPTTGIITIPIDGWYSGMWTFSGTSATPTSSIDVAWMNGAKTVFITRNFPTYYIPAPTNYACNEPFIQPLRAGSTILVNLGTGFTLTTSTCRISLVWQAPYNTYQGGN